MRPEEDEDGLEAFPQSLAAGALWCCAVAVVLLVARVVGGAEAPGVALTVVYQGSDLVPVSTVIEPPPQVDQRMLAESVRRAQRQAAAMPPPASRPDLAAVEPGPMVRARPARVRGSKGRVTAFAIGAGDREWLEQVAGEMRQAGAFGYVVEGTSEEVAALQELAGRLGLRRLAPVGGAAFASLYDVATYPVVVEGWQ